MTGIHLNENPFVKVLRSGSVVSSELTLRCCLIISAVNTHTTLQCLTEMLVAESPNVKITNSD